MGLCLKAIASGNWRLRKITGAGLAAVLVVSSLARVRLAMVERFQVDEYQCVHAAWSIFRGMLPYRDFFENHTPLTYYALQPFFWLFPRDQLFMGEVRLAFSFSLSLSILGLTFLLAEALMKDRVFSLLAAALLSVFPVFHEWIIEIRPDHLLMLFSVWALLLVASGPLRAKTLFLAGFLLGIGGLSSPKALFMLAAICLVMPAFSGGRGLARLKTGSRHALLVVLGFCAALAPFIAWYGALGGLPGISQWLVKFNFLTSNALAFHPEQIGDWIIPYGALCVASLLASTLTTAEIGNARHRRAIGLQWVLLLLVFAHMAVMPRPNVYSMLQFAPLIAIFSADGFRRVFLSFQKIHDSALRRRMIFGLSALGLIFVLESLSSICAAPQSEPPGEATMRTQEEQNAFQALLLRMSSPDEPILDGFNAAIFRPHSYFFANLINLVIFEHQERRYPPPGVPTLLETLKRRPPALIVMDRRLASIMTPEVDVQIHAHYAPAWLQPKLTPDDVQLLQRNQVWIRLP